MTDAFADARSGEKDQTDKARDDIRETFVFDADRSREGNPGPDAAGQFLLNLPFKSMTVAPKLSLRFCMALIAGSKTSMKLPSVSL